MHAAHPVSLRPSAGVALDAKLAFDGDSRRVPLRATGTTDAEGNAALDFDLPRETTGGEFRITVEARRGQLVQTATDEVRIQYLAEILLNTDKPLYQPGQMLHARILMLDAFTRRAIADADAEIKILNPDNEKLLSVPVKTSRFGIASVDWPIPDNTRLGEYKIRASVVGGKYDDGEAMHYVKISRYDLPNFSVNVKPDNKFYLPGQNAEVEVRADYLFGRPVKRGRGRVVRESSREWNYREQKWETEEEEKYEGEADEGGRFLARIDLSDAHAELTKRSDGGARFRDLSYAAYFTDPTTNRTEQRRFDLRVTAEAIHVYLIGDAYNQSRRLPVEFYVSTFYADGTPAPAVVEIKQEQRSPAYASANATNARALAPRTLHRLKTNRYGLAEVSDLRPALEASADEDESVSLVVTARDGKGRMGQRRQEFSISAGRRVVRVEASKTLYRAGEPLRVEIATSDAAARSAAVEILREWQVVHAQTVRLEGGRASVTIPYRREFRGELTLAVLLPPDADSDETASGAQTVLYPPEHELQLDVRMNQETYRPGEEARADVRVVAPGGGEVESALGIAVFDRALEERARSDREFGGGYRGYNAAYADFRGASSELSGVTRRELSRLTLSPRKTPEGLDLLAEIMLNRDGAYVPVESFSETFADNQSEIFKAAFTRQLQPLIDALNEDYRQRDAYPKTYDDLRRMLAARGLNPDALRDPWGMPYVFKFSVERDEDVLEVLSAAADKRIETDDDCLALSIRRPYFRALGSKITRALQEHRRRTGEIVHDAAMLKRVLASAEVDFDALRDPWGKAYRPVFTIDNFNFNVALRSGGANGRFADGSTHDPDDFTVWTTSIDYFAETRARIEAALDAYLKAGHRFPQTETEFRAALAHAKIDAGALIDPWGRPFQIAFTSYAWGGGGHATITTYALGGSRSERRDVRHIPKRMRYVSLTTHGEDGRPQTRDDFNIASFMRLVNEDADATPAAPATDATTKSANANGAASNGALSGVVSDVNGAVIPGARVELTHRATRLTYGALTNDEGFYHFGNLPGGFYELEITSPGFSHFVLVDVPVTGEKMTEIAAALQVGATHETVTVMAGDSSVDYSMSGQNSYSLTEYGRNAATDFKVESRREKAAGALAQDAPVSTPRLREYFPETLLWTPALETDASGRARFNFKLADNITTWKMSVIASTADGRIGLVEKEFRAFQPFFVEHDPPRILTEGDEIDLPVVVRNYLERAQTVGLGITPADWFTLSGAPHQTTEVAAGEAARATFRMRAVASVADGKQRVIAHTAADAGGAGDAIEKPVTVHPDGEELVATASRVFNGAGALEADIPADVIPATPRAELKLYPNLMTHVVEGVEGIMRRPYGCGEQTVSSTYPSLLVLNHYRCGAGRPQQQQTLPPVAAQAELYLRDGYRRLLGYRHANGGFAYWHNSDAADAPLTAYALQFLVDASTVIPVDRAVIRDARAWLVRQQTKEGTWKPRASYGGAEESRTLMQTAYVARVLARTRRALDALPAPVAAPDEAVAAAAGDGAQQAAGGDDARQAAAALKNALAYLAPRIDAAREPQLVASYALAAWDEKDTTAARRALALLRSQARNAGDASHWPVRTETPFHGWGLTGDIETTALVLQAFARIGTDETTGDAALRADDAALVNRALVYLFGHKDRFGVWHSTQATVNVLDTFAALSAAPRSTRNALSDAADSSGGDDDANDATGDFEIFVGGARVASLALPRSGDSTQVLNVDLSPFVNRAGRHRIEIRQAHAPHARPVQAVAQLVTTYYVPWSSASSSVSRADALAPAAANSSRATRDALSLAVKFDKTEAAANDEITCTVAARRTSASGHGMLLGEIGLPPGAEVDRASLERAVRDNAGQLDRYDVLPDRVVLYLWPHGSASVNFNFRFRPRFGLAAQSAPSLLYDYYNPAARTVVAPTRFMIR